MKFYKFLSIILALIISASIFTMPAFAADSASQLENENGMYNLESKLLKLKVSEDGELILTNIETGAAACSRNSYTANDIYSLSSYKKLMESEVVIDYYNINDASVSNQNSLAYSADAEISIRKEKNQIIAKYNFSSLKISFEVRYSVTDEYLKVDINTKSVKEGKEYKLNKISVLPGFFSGNGDDEGYIFVPDGCGALIDFNNDSDVTYTAEVYGKDISLDERLEKSKTENIKMPVFGSVKNNFAMFAIIDGGETASEISAASKNSENYYNYVYSSFLLRNTYSKIMFSADKTDRSRSTAYYKDSLIDGISSYSLRFYLLAENSGYTEMASVYRDYLIKEKGLKKQIEKPVLNVDLIGAIDVKANFLGFTYYKNKPLTKYNEAVDILKQLKNEGVDGIQLRYLGWNNNGLTNKKVLKDVSALRVLGGKKDLKNLKEWCKDNKVDVDFDLEMLKFYDGSKKYKVSNPFNETLTFSRYLRSVYAKDILKRSWFMLSAKYLNDNFKSVSSDLNKMEISDISLSSLSNTLYSDYNRKAQVNREKMKNNVVKILSDNKKNLKISGESANAYTLPYVNKIYSSPFYSSGYNIFNEEIPFYQIALHGVIDMTGESQFTSDDRNVNYLRAIETGSQLLYTGIASSTSEIVDTDYDYLYGTDFKLWFKDAVSKYKSTKPLLDKVYDKKIIKHSKLNEGIYKTVFENGVEVTVNYNSDAVTSEGTVIDGYGFYVRDAK